jgi:hypothetical protein
MAYLSPVGTEWQSPPFSNQHRSNILNHSKRKAEDELESQSHISSQFKKLRLQQSNASNLQGNAHRHIHQGHTHAVTSPISFRPHIANTDARPAVQHLPPPYDQDTPIHHAPPPPIPSQSLGDIHPPCLPEEDFMTIDETPHRIIIHDLSHELAQIEAEEQAAHASNNVFLPDWDKKVSALPSSVLGQNHDRNNHGMWSNLPHGMSQPQHIDDPTSALVLYRDPASISVPEEEDAVRKLIISARKRAREKALEDQKERERLEMEIEQGHGLSLAERGNFESAVERQRADERAQVRHFAGEEDLRNDGEEDWGDAMDIE